MSESESQKNERLLDFIIIISARKLQYLENVKMTFSHLDDEYQEAVKNTIANLDNTLFLTSHEKQNKRLQINDKIRLNEYKIRSAFLINFKRMHPQLYENLNLGAIDG